MPCPLSRRGTDSMVLAISSEKWPRPSSPIVLTGCVLGLPLLGLIGVLLISNSIRDYPNVRASTTWPVVEGRVIAASIEQKDGRRGRQRFVPNITYGFTVGSRQYRSQRINYGGVWTESSPEAAEQALRELAPNGVVKVFYNPSDPAEAVLQPGLSIGWYMLPIAGFFACLATAGATVYLLWPRFIPKKPRRSRRLESKNKEIADEE